MSEALTQALEALRGTPRYHGWLYRQTQAALGLRVLDVGSGLGEFAACLGAPRRQVVVSDAAEAMLASLRQRFAGQAAYQVAAWSLAEAPSAALQAAAPFDAITCVNVLEHVRADRAALRRLRALLGRQGRLVLIVPALPCLFGAVDRAVGHYRRYTRRTLNRRLHQAGFAIERQRYMNCFGIFTWWFSGRVLRRASLNPRLCRALDRLVPGLERLERWGAPPAGQSLVTICRKA